MIDTVKIIKFLQSAAFYRYLLLFFVLIFAAYNLLLLLKYLKGKGQPAGQATAEISLLPVKGAGKIFGFLQSRLGIFICELLLLTAILAIGTTLTVTKPKVIYPNSPALGVTEVSDRKPFKIIFDKPINTKTLEKSITPELKGSWGYESTNYGVASDTVIFTPKNSPTSETRYTLSFKKIKNVFGQNQNDYLLSFQTPVMPEVKNVNPQNGTEGVLPNQQITIELDGPNNDSSNFNFKIEPETALDVKAEGETKYILSAKNGFKKSTSYKLEIWRNPISKDYETKKVTSAGESTLVGQSNFRTIEAPGIADYGPKGSGIKVDSSIWISFRQDMNQSETAKKLVISPTIAGATSWEGNRKLIFKPSAPLQKETKYAVTMQKEATAIDGSPLIDNFSFAFVTIGRVAVTGFYPGSNATNISLSSTVSVTFNQAVDHASAQSKFSISPNVAGSFSWSGNTMIYNQTGFAYYTRYTVAVAFPVKTVYGLDSDRIFSSAFTTKQQTVTLAVPSYRQSHMYSCMASAARQALAFKKVNVSEDTILGLIGYDSTPFSGTWRDPNSIWGNPYSATVGNINGKSGGVNWGYGAYWGPTGRAISSYRPAEVKTGWSVQGVAQEIANGNPVLVWWVNGIWPAYEVWWKTPGGTAIRGVNSMHVQVVKGFTGTVTNPTSFIVNDSGYGYPQKTYDVGTFKAKWGWFGNSAVVVR